MVEAPRLDAIPEDSEDSKQSERAGGDQKLKSSLKAPTTQFLSPTSNASAALPIDRLSLFTEMKRSQTIKPQRRYTDFKLRYGRKKTDQVSKRIQRKADLEEDLEAAFLINALETNHLLRDLCQHEIVFMVLSSSTYQNLFKKIQKTLKDSLIPDNEIQLLYLSQNKVLAFEDCIQFTPQLFRLTKSIVVSEPLFSYKELLKQRMGSDAYQLSSARGIQGQYLKEKYPTMAKTRKLNPFRNQTVSKQSHFMDNMGIAIQKKLSILNNQMDFGMASQRAETLRRRETVRSRSPTTRKSVTF